MPPVLVIFFGIHTAMPIVTISLFAADARRVAVCRREAALSGRFRINGLLSPEEDIRYTCEKYGLNEIRKIAQKNKGIPDCFFVRKPDHQNR